MIGAFVPWYPEPRLERQRYMGWVVAENGCHLWTGSTNEKGYGHVQDAGRVRRVHRVRYEREVGPVPAGMELDHTCSVRHCCNPAHLRPVTHRTNLLAGNTIAAAAASRTHCPRGHALEGDNLRQCDLRHGVRSCRTCFNANQNAAHAERKRRERSRP